MKKLLALVLALVMTLGLATVGTNAANWSDLKDTDKVAADREEAFQVLNAIQVIEGDNEGNLNPDKQLTRAEAAAIIARLNLGKTTAESLTGVGSKFTDVPANFWDGKGAGYIEYCASTGIIAGRGDGTFDPNGDLTVAAFAKMLLVSLGYSAEAEKFLGPDWQVNVMSLANRAGLFAGATTPVANDKVKRADAALFAFNTLKTPMVTYGWSGSNMVPAGFAVGQTSAIYDTTNARDTQTISRALANDGTARGTYLVEFAERHFPNLVRDSHDTDEWGNPCTTWTLNRAKIDSYKNETMRVMSVTKSTTSADVYKAIGAELLVRMANNVAGENFIFNVYVDGVKANADDTLKVRNAIIANDPNLKLNVANTGLALSGAGTLFEVFVDDQSYADNGYSVRTTAISLVTTHTWLAEVTADMNNNGLGLNTYMAPVNDNGGTAMKADKDVVPEDMTSFKEGDRVLVQMTYPDDKDLRVVRHVLPSELASDTYVSGYTKSGKTMTSIRVDEEDKSLADKCNTNSEILNAYELQELRNYTYDVWADQYGNVIGIEFNKRDINYVFVTGFELASSYLASQTCKANVIWADGTMEQIQVSLTDKGTAAKYLSAVATADTLYGAKKTGSSTVNTWFTYSKSDAGQVVLDNVVGYCLTDTTTNKAVNQTGAVSQAAIALNKADVEISAATPTLQYKNGGVAFGNDKTVYITVDAKDGDAIGVNGGAITKVTGVTTGIKNVRIDTTDLKAADAAKDYAGFSFTKQDTVATTGAKDGIQNAPAAYANTYFIYNENTGYVLAAVVVSTSKGGDTIYVISQARRDYVKGVGYVDTYNAIVNGEKTTIQVDCTASGTNDNKLKDGSLIIGRKSGDYYVAFEDTAVNTLNTSNNSKFGYVKATGLNGSTRKVTLKENTLWIEDNKDNSNYILTNGETVYFVNEGAGTTWTKYTTAGAALAAGNVKNKTFITSVYGDCDGGTGVAKTVIFVVAKTGTAVAGTGTTGGVGSKTYTTNAQWDDKFGGEIVVRYEGAAAPTAGQIKAQVAALTGETVKKVTAVGGQWEITTAEGNTYYVDPHRVYSIRVDGVIQKSWDRGDTFAKDDKLALTKGMTYMYGGDNAATGPDAQIASAGIAAATVTTVNAMLPNKVLVLGATDTEVNITGAAVTMDRDICLNTAYEVKKGTVANANTPAFEFLNEGVTAYTPGTDAGVYLPVGSKINVLTTAPANAYLTVTNKAKDNAELIAGKLNTAASLTTKEELLFTLTGTTEIDATVTYLVKYQGADLGYYKVGDKVTFDTGIVASATGAETTQFYTETKNVAAAFDADGKVQTAGNAVSVDLLKNSKEGTYTVVAADASAATGSIGEINIIPAVEITFTAGDWVATTGVQYLKADKTTWANAATGDLFKIGTQIKLVEKTATDDHQVKIQTNLMTAAEAVTADNGGSKIVKGVTGGDPASCIFTLGEYKTVAFTVA